MKKKSIKLYEINREVECLECGNKGAVQSFGEWYPKGLGEEVGGSKALEGYRTKAFMSHSMGFGGTIPQECLNCGNSGLVDIGGLEGYKQGFKTIEDVNVSENRITITEGIGKAEGQFLLYKDGEYLCSTMDKEIAECIKSALVRNYDNTKGANKNVW